jgi:hypothetical protein
MVYNICREKRLWRKRCRLPMSTSSRWSTLLATRTLSSSRPGVSTQNEEAYTPKIRTKNIMSLPSSLPSEISTTFSFTTLPSKCLQSARLMSKSCSLKNPADLHGRPGRTAEVYSFSSRIPKIITTLRCSTKSGNTWC